ncbi:translation initiation factor IF-2 subunit alpha [Stetteria hydrogenophila]
MAVAIKPRKPLPDVGELVVGTVKEVYDYGAYLDLDEYGGVRAFLPWSEIASRMVRNIRQVLRENQKVVVKVIRVYKKRGQVDVSLKRVTDGERRRKMMWWKRTLKAAAIIERAAEKLGAKPEEAHKILWKLNDYYGDALTALEQAVIYGIEPLLEAGIPEEWAKAIYETAKTRIEVRQVKISGVFTLTSLASDGIERVKKVLQAAREAALSVDPEHVKVRIYTLGAPRYRIDLTGHDYKILEKALAQAVEKARETAEELGVTFKFERLKT